MSKHVVVCVDDEIDNVEALERLFRKKYRVVKATSGAEALKLIQKEERVTVIISDQRMPQMTGVEFLKKSTKHHPEAVRILLTGYTDIESVIGAINSGQVYRYLTKPWDPVDLANTIDKAVEKYELSAELEKKNKALEEALDELKTLDKAKNSFMILINHELKTPLTTILSFIDLIKETKLDADQEKYLFRISQSADRLHELIDDALELVSAESGQIKPTPKKIKTEKLFSMIDKTFIEEATNKSQNIVFDSSDLSVIADPNIISSVLNRLVENAVQHGDRKSDIIIASEAETEGRLRFSITNKGRSLSKEAIKNILKPFSVSEDILNHSRGSGLGLSVVQALLKQHDSNLEIECPKGKFKASFELPLA